MKPAPFDYYAPETLEEALALMSQHGYDAKVLAGGQSLIPTMNFRLSQPAVLVDLNRISTLRYIDADPQSGLHIGAMTRQRTIERSQAVIAYTPLLHDTMPYIAHMQIRNRGTFGGSLAHADPAAELPAVAVALDAKFRVRSLSSEREIAARDFYIALFTTELAADEILTEIIIPPQPERSGWSIQELSRRHGDYALVGVAVHVVLDAHGTCNQARIVLLSVGEGPVAAEGAASVLVGEAPSDAVITAAADIASDADIEPMGDIHASAEYRRHLAKTLTRRALAQAFERAQTYP